VAQSGVGVVFGAAIAGSLLIVGAIPLVALAPAVIAPVIGVTGARVMHNHVVTRAQLALEQLLDRLERGEFSKRGADSLLGAIVAAATAIPSRRP